MGFSSENSVYINESLTSSTRDLLKLTKIKAKEKNYTQVWTSNCLIFVRKEKGKGDLIKILSIQRMVAFIDHEARERAEEIDSNAEGEFCNEKGCLLRKARQDLQRIYDKKERIVTKQDQTTEGTLKNHARLRILACREAHISRIEAEVQDRLLKMNEDLELYKSVLLKMLIQGLFRMLERVVIVRVREQDLTIIEQLLQPAQEQYRERVGHRVKIVVDNSRFLAPSCLGGVELATPNWKVRVQNTFLKRLQMTIKQLVPAIGKQLFEHIAPDHQESHDNYKLS